MNEKHHHSVRQYLNDMLAVERDIANAVSGQLTDDRLEFHPQLIPVLHDLVLTGEQRIASLKALADEEEGGKLGAAVKEATTAVTGILAGIYGKLREHPISRMVRDDIVALNVAATSYGMLRTLALATGHSALADLALDGLRACPPLILRLTDLLPEIITAELATDAPLTHPAAASIALSDIREAWEQDLIPS